MNLRCVLALAVITAAISSSCMAPDRPEITLCGTGAPQPDPSWFLDCLNAFCCGELADGTASRSFIQCAVDHQCAPPTTVAPIDAAVCGNGVLEQPAGEECDGKDVGLATCTSAVGMPATGELGCNPDCTYDTSLCLWCGNGVRDVDEECDRSDLGSQTCGQGSTELPVCTDQCQIDRTNCTPPPSCGDGHKDPGEQCDGQDLGGSICSTAIPGAFGTLGCAGNCVFDTSLCGWCGDWKKNGAEQCDNSDLENHDCSSFGWNSGHLYCDVDCLFVTSDCHYDVTVSNVDDATLLRAYPDWPAGSSTQLSISASDTDTRSSLIRPRNIFSYISPNSQVLTADLCLYADSSTTGLMASLSLPLAGWTEATVTYNSQPFVYSTIQKWFWTNSPNPCVDVTPYVQNWVNGDPNYGVSIGGDDGTAQTFYSHESGYGPSFHVTFR